MTEDRKGGESVSQISEKALRAAYEAFDDGSMEFEDWRQYAYVRVALPAFQRALYAELREKARILQRAHATHRTEFECVYISDVLEMLEPPKPDPPKPEPKFRATDVVMLDDKAAVVTEIVAWRKEARWYSYHLANVGRPGGNCAPEDRLRFATPAEIAAARGEHP